MGATVSVIKTLFVPALIALLAYVFLTFALVPAFQYYRNRYSHYLPLDTLSTQTQSLRQHMQGAAGRLFMPSTWRWHLRLPDPAFFGSNGLSGGGGILGRSTGPEVDFLSDEEDYSESGLANHRFAMSEEGEELGTIRQGSERVLRGTQNAGYDTSRLSRDLEQGFMDDSDEDEPTRN